MEGASTSIQRRMHKAFSIPRLVDGAGERLFSSDKQLAGQRPLPELEAALTRIGLAHIKNFREVWLEEEMHRVQNIFGSLSTTVLDDNIGRMRSRSISVARDWDQLTPLQDQTSLAYLLRSGSSSNDQAHDDGYDDQGDAGGPSPEYRSQLAKQAIYDVGRCEAARPSPDYRGRVGRYLQAIFEQLKLQVALSNYYYPPSRLLHMRLVPLLSDNFHDRPRDDLFRDVRNMQQYAVAYGVSDEDPIMSVADAGEFFWAHAFEQQLKRKIRYSHGHTMGLNEMLQVIRRD